ncbi:MAG: archaeal proteasome endopeptidase complex subunit beta [Desulfurococcales archaeon]|nr:archaeal proteasome endopeptidase complex subunit beta [Desulfurococcales archaeon]
MASQYFGATAVGVKVNDGVVLATDKRMSYGGFILSRSFRKLFHIRKKIGVAFAGLYGDVGGLVRIVEASMKLYSLESGKEPSVANVAKYLSALLYSYKIFPFYVEVLVGGVEPEGKPTLYVLDPLGSIIEDNYTAAGSGATIAFGVLEEGYKEDLSLQEAEKLAHNAVLAAIKRDASSGDGVDLLIIPVNGDPAFKSTTLKLVS